MLIPILVGAVLGGLFALLARRRGETGELRLLGLGLVVPGVVVEDIATTATTLPDFVTRWKTMLDERHDA